MSLAEAPATAPAATTERRAGLAPGRDWLWLIGLWAVVTACNLFKPYHIDDGAHLEIARWIMAHPLHPMSGILNWENGVDEPIWRTNQPHLYFYALALWGRLFGFSEPAMHALQSLAALACILLFHRLARSFPLRSAAWTTAMLVLGPAFVVEQNLMVDVPLLATWLAFFNLLICDRDDASQTRRYVLAALACSAALLIKYSSLALLPVLWISLLAERRRAQAWTALIPLAVLAAWSGFNYLDYGGVHIAGRPSSGDHGLFRPLRMGLAWFIGLGALTPLGLLVAGQAMAGRPSMHRLLYPAVAAALALLAASVMLGVTPDGVADKLLWATFAVNAALICWPLAISCLDLAGRPLWRREAAVGVAPQLYLLLWLAGATAFYALLSPFMAARHVLLILPPVLLLVASRWGQDLTRASMTVGLACTVVASAGLGLSDWRFAAFYRSEAAALARTLPKTGAIWASGHWGWQWYAERNGFREVDVRASPLRPGDLLIVPEEVDHQDLTQPVSLTRMRTDHQQASLNPFCTGRPALFYDYAYKETPWTLSRACTNTVDVFRVGPR